MIKRDLNGAKQVVEIKKDGKSTEGGIRADEMQFPRFQVFRFFIVLHYIQLTSTAFTEITLI